MATTTAVAIKSVELNKEMVARFCRTLCCTVAGNRCRVSDVHSYRFRLCLTACHKEIADSYRLPQRSRNRFPLQLTGPRRLESTTLNEGASNRGPLEVPMLFVVCSTLLSNRAQRRCGSRARVARCPGSGRKAPHLPGKLSENLCVDAHGIWEKATACTPLGVDICVSAASRTGAKKRGWPGPYKQHVCCRKEAWPSPIVLLIGIVCYCLMLSSIYTPSYVGIVFIRLCYWLIVFMIYYRMVCYSTVVYIWFGDGEKTWLW